MPELVNAISDYRDSLPGTRRDFERDEKDPLHPLHQYFRSQTARACIRLLAEERLLPLTGQCVGDVGCGSGLWLMEFMRWGAHSHDLAGVDLDESRLAIARERMPSARLERADGRRLPWQTGSMDLITQFTVFTSLLEDEQQRAVAAEMLRALRPCGSILWYDFCYDNPRNPNVRGVNRRRIAELFPGCDIRYQTTTLAPPLARRLVRFSWALAMSLEGIPLLRTHCLALIRPRWSSTDGK